MEPRYRTPRLHGLDVESLYCWWLKKNPCTQLGSIKPNLVDHGISTNLTWCGSSSINSREVFRMNLKNIFEAKTHPPPRLRLFWFILATRGWCFGGQWWNLCGWWSLLPLLKRWCSTLPFSQPVFVLEELNRYLWNLDLLGVSLSTAADTHKITKFAEMIVDQHLSQQVGSILVQEAKPIRR